MSADNRLVAVAWATPVAPPGASKVASSTTTAPTRATAAAPVIAFFGFVYPNSTPTNLLAVHRANNRSRIGNV
jgi:hypothetical protein